MDFSVEFYETAAGARPVQDFLDELKASDPDDFAAVVAGLAKLRHRQYHREPLSKAARRRAARIAPCGQAQHPRVVVFHEESADHRGARNPQ